MASNSIIFDIEADGLLDEATKVHCLSYQFLDSEEVHSITDYDDMRELLNRGYNLIGHNIICYDLPLLKKIIGGGEFRCGQVIDTLGLSWYIENKRDRHGLESYGVEYGLLKVEIDDWDGLTIEDYLMRCERDVQINARLYREQMQFLNSLYEGNTNRLISYIMFKMDCLRDQQETRCRIDIESANRYKDELTSLIKEKTRIIEESMPFVESKKLIRYPGKRFYKKDGELSIAGKKYLEALKELDLPADYKKDLVVTSYEEKANALSNTQMKLWLFAEGWKPDLVDEIKVKGRDNRYVPKILNSKKKLSKSVLELANDIEAIKEYEGLIQINNRLCVIDSFLENMDEEGFVISSASGLTNTNRLKHRKPIVNLPKLSEYYGKEIRGLIIAKDDEHWLLGTDLSGIESATQDHYMYFFDPDYVREKRVPGFDAHLDIGKLGGLIDDDEEQFFKWYKSKH